MNTTTPNNQQQYSPEVMAAVRLLDTPPQDIHPAAKAEYATTHQAAVEVLLEEKDLAKRQQMAGYYKTLLGQYAEYARRSTATMAGIEQQYFTERGSAIPRIQGADIARQMNYEFWAHFQTGAYPTAHTAGMKTMPDMDVESGFPAGTSGTPPREAFNRLSAKLRGANITSIVYDSKEAEKTGSIASGLKLGGIVGAVLGFLGSDRLGLEGTWKWIARIGGSILGGIVGNLAESAITGKKSETPAIPPAYAPSTSAHQANNVNIFEGVNPLPRGAGAPAFQPMGKSQGTPSFH